MSDFIPVYEPTMYGNELKYATDAIKSTWISSLGKYISLFESGFAKFVGCKTGVAVCNGTAALHIALVGLNIGKGDEVIIPDLTFVATANAVKYTGAEPVFVDVDKETWQIDPKAIEKAITKKTKAIMVVHLYGHPCDMDPIMALAHKHNLKVIEDAAEAHGAEYKGQKVGSIGDVGCFSLYGNKIITTGEGGMIVCNDPKLAERMRFLKDHAMDHDKRYYHPEIGFNYRLTNVQAAIGLGQLEHIEEAIENKRRIAKLYNDQLGDVKGISLPPEGEGIKNVYWMYCILIGKEFGISRDELMEKLQEAGIGTRPFFIPMHQLPPYKDDGKKFPNSKLLGDEGINLPSSAHLSDSDVHKVCEIIRGLA
tara:strand:- start:822 stop:1922 length:1101 start_codon:yes stop_codon:yes gene_type:complete